MQLVGYHSIFPTHFLSIRINIKIVLVEFLECFLFKNEKIFSFVETLHSNSEDKSGGLSKYLPLRFLVCMISAIANPFLYGYFNETFKDGLEKIFSICCRNRTNVPVDKNDIPPLEITFQKHQNGGLASRSGMTMGKSTEVL